MTESRLEKSTGEVMCFKNEEEGGCTEMLRL